MATPIPEYSTRAYITANGDVIPDTGLALANADSLLIRRGLIVGTKLVEKFGRHPNIQAATEQDIFMAGVNFTYPTASVDVLIYSSSSADDGTSSPLGTGCWTATIYGCDDEYNEISETRTLSGTTPVSSATSPLTKFFRVWRVKCGMCGSGGENAGNIKVVDASSPEGILSYVTATHGQSEQAQYTVPAGKVAHIDSGHASCQEEEGGALKETSAIVHIWVREYNEASYNNYDCWRAVQTTDVNNRGSTGTPIETVSGIPEKSDIRASADAGVDGTSVSVRMNILVVDV